MSWLVRMELSANTTMVAGIRDSYDWHQRLWECFPNNPMKTRDFLTRIDYLEGTIRVWMITQRPPVCPVWCPEENFEVRKIAPTFLSHSHYAFDLRANPTKAVVQRGSDGIPKQKTNGKRASGKRIPILRQEELRKWIDRKAVDSGFRISEAKPLEIGPSVSYWFRKNGRQGVHAGVQFRGVLKVSDPAKFSHAYANGIGGAKSFGFGLLLISPVQI